MFEWLKLYKLMPLVETPYSVPESSGCSVSVEEGMLLYALVRLHKPKTIVEIGTCTGFSTRFLAQAVRDNGFGKVYTIDVNPQFQNDGGWPEIEVFRGFSHDVLGSGKINNVDFAFIDGDHTYAAVKDEIDQVLEISSEKCLMALHDVLYYPELLKLWDELPHNKILLGKRTGLGMVYYEKR